MKAALAGALVALAAAAPALGAFPGPEPGSGQFPESPRANTPNDPGFDRCEPDDEQTPELECDSYFSEQWELFGFRPESATTVGGQPLTYSNCEQLDAQGRDANQKAGDPECSQIGGVRADSAWKYSTGDPDVVVAILDTGIRWQNGELIEKVHLNTRELPKPQGSAAYDANGDGKVSVSDWKDDPRVANTAGHAESDSVLDASDLIAAFSDGTDADANKYVDDIAGWDFFDDDNDAFDASSCCSAEGHGSGRAQEAVRATNDGAGDAGLCPECQVMPVRVWDTFVVDSNMYALGVVYATDNGASVVEGAVGGLLNSSFARRAFTYADSKGVALTLVSSDINSANHNYPTNYNEAIYVSGSLPDTAPSESCESPDFPGIGGGMSSEECVELIAALRAAGVPIGLPGQLPTTSFFRNSNLTQYGGKADIVLVGDTGSVNTGQASGAAGLLKSYAREPGVLPGPTLSGNEVRQLLTMTAEDVLPQNTGSIGSADKANPGWDPHFGYGRVNLAGAMRRIQDRRIPPEVQINSPDWFAPIDASKVGSGGVPIRARIASPHFSGPTTWKLEYACGQDALDADYAPLAQGEVAGDFAGELGRLSKALLTNLASNCDGSIANDPGLPAGNPKQVKPPWPVDPYPDPDPMRHNFQIRLTARQKSDPDNVGVYRKALFAHPDEGALPGWPKPLGPFENAGLRVTGSGGESAPRLADLNGDNRLDVIIGTSSGELHVLGADGKPLPSWNGGKPVRTRPYAQATKHKVGGLPPLEPLRVPAIGDITGDKEPEVVVTAGEHVYAWHRDGDEVRNFPRRIDPVFSAPCKPGKAPCLTKADRNLTEELHLKRGFFASPALADLDGNGRLDIVAGSLDQRVYAWDGSGRSMPGFPVRLDSEGADNGAEIINTPTIVDLDGDKKPEVVLATNEIVGSDDPGADFARKLINLFLGNATGTSVTYALHGNGKEVAGWPVHTGAAAGDLLPLVLPGHDAAAGDVDPTNPGPEVAISAGTGIAGQLVAGDSSSLREFANAPSPLLSGVTDTSVVLHLADYPSIGRLSDLAGPSVIKGGLSAAGAANLLAVNQNLAFNHVVQAWDPRTGAYRLGWPLATDDFQLVTQPAIAKVDGSGGGRQALVGTGLYQLHAYGEDGTEPSGWPKTTGGWLFAVPSVGDLDADGTLDVVTMTREGWVFAWKTGAPACQAGSTTTNNEWWTFHHDEHSTANYDHDARPPSRPGALSLQPQGDDMVVSFRGSGDDMGCGDAKRYEVVGSDEPVITGGDFKYADPLAASAVKSQRAGGQPVSLVAKGGGRYAHIAVRAVDDAGNVSYPASVGRGGAAVPTGTTTRKRCLPRRVRVSARRIGPARLGRRLSSLTGRYRVTRRTRSSARFCVRGGGRFTVGLKRRRIDLVASTAKGHRTRQTGPGRRVRRGRPRGSRPLTRRLRIGFRSGKGRVIYGIRRRRTRFLAVVTRGQAKKAKRLERRLRRLGFR